MATSARCVGLHRGLLGALLLIALAAPAHAQSGTDFKGETISIQIGYGPGGGYDTYGRALARHLGRFIPGNPLVLPKNMPGAGSLRAANHIYSLAAARPGRDRHLLGLDRDGAVDGQRAGEIRRDEIRLDRQHEPGRVVLRRLGGAGHPDLLPRHAEEGCQGNNLRLRRARRRSATSIRSSSRTSSAPISA